VKGLAVALTILVVLAPGVARAHEERLMVGRVEVLEPARKLLVVSDRRGGERRRLEVNEETEVIVCRTLAGLDVLPAGALVRVKYLDRPGAEPEVQSILVLGREKRQRR
jgi:hypothetical protein